MNNVTIQLVSEDNLAEVLPFVRAYHKFEELKLTEIERERSDSKAQPDKWTELMRKFLLLERLVATYSVAALLRIFGSTRATHPKR